MDCSLPPGFPILHYLPGFAQTQVHCLSDTIPVILSHHLILCCPLLLLLSIFPSIRVFSNESALHIRWPKDRSFSVSPSNEYSGLISFRIDLFDGLAFQWTLKNLLQHHNLKAWVLWCSAFFMVQHSHLYVSNRKTIFDNTDLCRQSDVFVF